jgi:hypothetical protein
MKLTSIPQTFRGGDGTATRLRSQGYTTWARDPIHQHGTGSALARFAASFDASIPFAAQEGKQVFIGLHIDAGNQAIYTQF